MVMKANELLLIKRRQGTMHKEECAECGVMMMI